MHPDAEYAIIHTEAAVKIPEGMDAAKVAPLLCAGVTVFNSLRKMNIVPGGIVAVQGLGGLGHLALQYSRKMGYRTVALSRDGSKKEFATQLGAHDYLDATEGDAGQALQKLGGADCILATAPNPAIMSSLVAGLAPQGKLVVLARTSSLALQSSSLPLLLDSSTSKQVSLFVRFTCGLCH